MLKIRNYNFPLNFMQVKLKCQQTRCSVAMDPYKFLWMISHYKSLSKNSLVHISVDTLDLSNLMIII